MNVVFGHLEEPIGLAAQSAWMGAVGSKLLWPLGLWRCLGRARRYASWRTERLGVGVRLRQLRRCVFCLLCVFVHRIVGIARGI